MPLSLFRNWFRKHPTAAVSPKQVGAPARRAAANLSLEPLEARDLPAPVAPISHPIEGRTWTGQVVAFRAHPGPALAVTAVIDWGDRKPTTAVAATPVTPANWTGPVLDWRVNASHLYNHWGTYTLKVTAYDQSHRIVYSQSFSQHVTFAPVTLQPVPFTGIKGQTLNYVVASGTYRRPDLHQATVGDLTATIYWGDNVGVGTKVPVSVSETGSFLVYAPHAYTIAGNLPVHVNIAYATASQPGIPFGPAPSITERAMVVQPRSYPSQANTYNPALDPMSARSLGLTPGLTGPLADLERDVVLAAAVTRDAFVSLMKSPALRTAVSGGGGLITVAERAAAQQGVRLLAASASHEQAGLIQLAQQGAPTNNAVARAAAHVIQNIAPPSSVPLTAKPNLRGFTVSYFGGLVRYGPTDGLGRSTGIFAIISPEMITRQGNGFGTPANSSLTPPGYAQTVGNVFARGHLLANLLGGSGQITQNLVTLYQRGVNNGEMSKFEGQVARVVESGKTVFYEAIPVYSGSNPIPQSIMLYAQSTDGTFRQGVQIINQAGPVKVIDITSTGGLF